uniref:Uncharacterized protein n=1 Tax=Anguilla anguilla TaxID=7936 RepID=A0A0E9VST4_ANGAN
MSIWPCVVTIRTETGFQETLLNNTLSVFCFTVDGVNRRRFILSLLIKSGCGPTTLAPRRCSADTRS